MLIFVIFRVSSSILSDGDGDGDDGGGGGGASMLIS